MSELTQQLSALAARLDEALKAVGDEKGLEELRIAYLGRNGEVTAVRRQIGTLPAAERPAAGKTINDAVGLMEAQFERAEAALRSKALAASLEQSIDVTFPGTSPLRGSIHPIRRTINDACRYFERHGFAVVLGNEIETGYHNFDALNIPPDHPAREGLDSFYVRPDLVLRTHTSPMQIRTMQSYPPPVAIVVPGKAFRRDAVDARHSYMFHQIEGLMIGEGIHFGHLKGMLQGMCRELFGPRQAVRFRPSFFPFTEPSAEVDTTCPACSGSGGACRTCGGSGWIEIGGSGMVHPDVLREVKYDPSRVSGWAFGMGIERIAMVRHDMDDIRAFFENEPGFLEQLA
ncbi:MAG TPA: phenylalanine--tRNA ligase subunit alpha [Candidatus Binatia bacterium]|nr:phenylalanine--tRNA ligase subunit alpha [Candidatus Binatia bacterium]